jgi:general secretion pathway protein F
MDMTFELVVRGRDGRLLSQRRRAADARQARAEAARTGVQVLHCEPLGFGRRVPGVSRPARLNVSTFAEELASLLEAGMSVSEALRTLTGKETGAGRKTLLINIANAVSEGQPLSAALAQQPDCFPALMLAAVQASEQTGDLCTALNRFAQHQNSFKALRDKVLGAAIYPAVLLALGSLVVAFLLGVVVPKFALLIESAHKELPWSSHLLMSWGQGVARHPGTTLSLVLGIVGCIGFLLSRALRRGAPGQWAERMPFVGSSVRQFRHSQLYRTAGMLIQGGVPAPRALQLASSLLGPEDQKRLARAIGLMGEGYSASRALSDAKASDPVAVSMLAVAERTGSLARMLEHIARFHEARLQRSIELTSRLFEPALMIVIGLVIGGIVVLMYLPIFDLASSLQ